MDVQKIKELALANGFSLKEQASGNMDLHSYVYEFANAIEQAVKAQAVPEGFVLVPKEPTDIEIESIKEKHWDMRGCQLCKSDYIDLYKAMIGACDDH